jgi:hypothetical protein
MGRAQNPQRLHRDAEVIPIRSLQMERRTGRYDALNEDQLYRVARERDIPNRSFMARAELIAALERSDRR